MKYLLLLLTFFLLLPTLSYAATPTPTDVSPTISSSQKNESLVQQINELKDKIASRVAQLKLVEKRGVVGIVTEANDTHITLTDVSGNIQLIDVDEITKFQSSSPNSSFGISDVQKGTAISVMGLYNKESKHILARFISSFTLPVFLSGTVSNVSSSDYTVTVASSDNKSTIVDIENTTKINAYTNGKISRSGFSKMNTGDRVEIVGYPNKTEKNRITGSYILQLNDLANSSSPSVTP